VIEKVNVRDKVSLGTKDGHKILKIAAQPLKHKLNFSMEIGLLVAASSLNPWTSVNRC